MSNTEHLRRNAQSCIRTSSPALRQWCGESLPRLFGNPALMVWSPHTYSIWPCWVCQKYSCTVRSIIGLQHGIFILVIDLMDSAVLETKNVNRLHGKSIICICDFIKYKIRWDTMPTATWHTPSSLKTGRHSQWWSSTLHLMRSWAQLHRQSLFGICASKSGSCWMNLSSHWPITGWLQLLLHQYQLIVACCNLFSCNGTVVLCVCWHVTIIVAITVIVIVKVALAFGRIQWHNNIDCCIRCHVGRLLLCDKDNANQR